MFGNVCCHLPLSFLLLIWMLTSYRYIILAIAFYVYPDDVNANGLTV